MKTEPSEKWIHELSKCLLSAIEASSDKEKGIRTAFPIEPEKTLVIDVFYSPMPYENFLKANGQVPLPKNN